MSEVHCNRIELYYNAIFSKKKYCCSCFIKSRLTNKKYIRRVTYGLGGSRKTVYRCSFCKKYYKPRYKTFTDVNELLPLIKLTRLPRPEERITITTAELVDFPSLIDIKKSANTQERDDLRQLGFENAFSADEGEIILDAIIAEMTVEKPEPLPIETIKREREDSNLI